MEYKVVSLFSGAGGLDLGFVQTGRYKILFANDKLETSLRTYSINIGLKLSECFNNEDVEAEKNTALVCDIENVSFNQLKGEGIDVIVGGPPCQDFSVLRGQNRKGIEVKRGRLYAHFVRALVSLQPKLFVFENVPGLMSANQGLAYKVILEDFKNLNLRWDEVKRTISAKNYDERIEGYELLFAGKVDFSRFGVPQKRQRLLIIGIRRDLIGQRLQLLQKFRDDLKSIIEGEGWLFYKYPLTPIEAFEGKPLDQLNDKYHDTMLKWKDIFDQVKTERALKWKEKIWDHLTFDIIHDYLFLNGVNGMKSDDEIDKMIKEHKNILKELGYYGKPVGTLNFSDHTNDLPNEDDVTIERLRRIPPGENYEFVEGTSWGIKRGRISSMYRRIHPLKPAYTVTAYGGGGTQGYHYDRERSQLTLREKARLQTFPDDFSFYGGKTKIRAQIGEAVPPLAMKRIADFIASGVLDMFLH